MDSKQIYKKLQENYSAVAKTASGKNADVIAKAFGYTTDELANIPADANLGLSCGNPLALSKLREGETVIDLGSGAGFDVFLAAKIVGAGGKAIGVDMNKDMLQKANRIKESTKADNVIFVESAITNIALPAAAADCVISNCVINLVPELEKQLAFNEIFRLLRPGGRVAMSDILARKELPENLKQDMALYVGCIAGASRVEDYEGYLRNAGFADILILDSKHDLSVYNTACNGDVRSSCCGGGKNSETSSFCCSNAEISTSDGHVGTNSSFKDIDVNEWAGSFQIFALKP